MMTSRLRNRAASLILLFLFSVTSFGQSRESQGIAILDSIYNLNFNDAALQLAHETISSERLKPLLEIQLMRWKHVPIALSPEAEQYLHKLLTLDESFAEEEQDNQDLYLKICHHFMLAEFHYSKGNQWQAVNTMKKIYPWVLQCFKDSLQLPEYDFIKGIYLYYADYYCQNLAGKILFSSLKKGDREAGLRLLSKAAFSKSIAGVEAAIYYAQIQSQYERNSQEAISVYARLSEQYPRNTKFKELYVQSLLASKQYTKAQAIIDELLDADNSFYHCAGYLFRGILEEDFLNNPQQAKNSYNSCKEAGKPYGGLLQRYCTEAEVRLGNLR